MFKRRSIGKTETARPGVLPPGAWWICIGVVLIWQAGCGGSSPVVTPPKPPPAAPAPFPGVALFEKAANLIELDPLKAVEYFSEAKVAFQDLLREIQDRPQEEPRRREARQYLARIHAGLELISGRRKYQAVDADSACREAAADPAAATLCRQELSELSTHLQGCVAEGFLADEYRQLQRKIAADIARLESCLAKSRPAAVTPPPVKENTAPPPPARPAATPPAAQTQPQPPPPTTPVTPPARVEPPAREVKPPPPAGKPLGTLHHDGRVGESIVLSNKAALKVGPGGRLLKEAAFRPGEVREYSITIASFGDLEVCLPPGYELTGGGLQYSGEAVFEGDNTRYKRYILQRVGAGTVIGGLRVRRQVNSPAEFLFIVKLYPR